MDAEQSVSSTDQAADSSTETNSSDLCINGGETLDTTNEKSLTQSALESRQEEKSGTDDKGVKLVPSCSLPTFHLHHSAYHRPHVG
jgi:hypothetical protein